MAMIWFINSWNVAGVFANANGITFHRNTCPLGAITALNSFALPIRSICQKTERLSSLVLYFVLALYWLCTGWSFNGSFKVWYAP